MSRYRWSKNGAEHRLVWESAYGPIPNGYVIHHIDGNGKNNELSNLQLMTIGEHNSLHARLKREGNDVIDASDPDVIEFRKRMKISSARHYANNKEKENERCRKYRRDHHDTVRDREREYYKTHKDVRERYLRENRDLILEKGRVYRETHRDAIRMRSTKYYHDHKEEESARTKKYRLEHQEQLQRFNASYHQTHKEEIHTRKRDWLIGKRKEQTQP